MDCKKTGAFIADLRKGSGLTQVQLAEKLGVTGGAVSNPQQPRRPFSKFRRLRPPFDVLTIVWVSSDLPLPLPLISFSSDESCIFRRRRRRSSGGCGGPKTELSPRFTESRGVISFGFRRLRTRGERLDFYFTFLLNYSIVIYCLCEIVMSTLHAVVIEMSG